MNTSGPDADDLDARLRALFADSRLDVTPGARAEERIVAGARRLRRRRAVLAGGGTTLAVVAVAAAVMVAGSRTGEKGDEIRVAASPAEPPPASASVFTTREPDAPDDPPPLNESRTPGAEHPTSSHLVSPPPGPSTAATPPVHSGSVVIADAVLDPDGYRALKLGMPYREAVATDMLMVSGETPPPPTCADYALVEGDASVRSVTISRQYGVVGFAANNAVTPEGAGVGTSVDQLKGLYPGGRQAEAAYTVDTGAGFYEFRVPDGVVTEVTLKAHTSDC
ncbi:hypothetical protein [Saccharomonospora cyanea]|uniref:Uncharacterized protein n=1 Tax=Saccharomonospora cyanea NA-134 TaxID=882082 RepID=H5XQL4_9PSEU|nr:hypothetical protein [Saccharomonospora cyanea]EHR59060.1 hypothetical protein SaccyDRAFT_0120 [Saccharomonospora cyanea NA-134]